MGWDQLVSTSGHGFTGSTIKGESMPSSRIHSGYSSMVAVRILDCYCHLDVLRHSTPIVGYQAMARKICKVNHLWYRSHRFTAGITLGSTSWIYRLGTILLLRFTTFSNFGTDAIPTSTYIVFRHCDHIRFFDSFPLSTGFDSSILGTHTSSDARSYANAKSIRYDTMW
jgi:hypothetical protein